jgi:hypothetical protein
MQAIFWIDANSESTVKQSFQAIAERIKNSTIRITEDVAVNLILVEFRDWAEPWLMVFDNYDDVKIFKMSGNICLKENTVASWSPLEIRPLKSWLMT